MAQQQAGAASDQLRELRQFVSSQPSDFKINWTRDGTIYFVQTDDQLAPHRAWLESFFKALQSENRDTLLSSLASAAESLNAER